MRKFFKKIRTHGFTLVELLAVIIVLAIIALIATPVILNVVEDAREEARKDSVIGYADAVRLSYAEDILDQSGDDLKDLADKKMQGEEVNCNIVKYNTELFGTMLHGCNVEGKGNYCYFNGRVYQDGSLECESVYEIITTDKVTYKAPRIDVASQNPVNSSYGQSKRIKVEFPTLAIVEEHYYVRTSGNVTLPNTIGTCGTGTTPSACSQVAMVSDDAIWYEVSGDIEFEISENMVIEAAIGKGGNYTSSSYEEKLIDTSGPEVDLTLSVKTDRVIVSQLCSDSESGISKYEYKLNSDEFIESSSDGYVFEGLAHNTEYEVTVRCTNGSGMVNTASDKITTTNIANPTILQTSQTPSDILTYPEYATSRVIKVNYNNDNLQYYLRSSVSSTVPTGLVSHKCEYVEGNFTNCSEETTTSLAADTWYKVTNKEASLTYIQNGNLIAIVTDGTNVVTSSTYTITNIDTTEPEVSIENTIITSDSVKITVSCIDDYSGITKYEFSKDNGANWVDNGTENVYTFNGLTQATNYTFKVRCTNGSALTNASSITKQTSTILNPTIGLYTQTPSSGYSYFTEKVIRITYDGSNITSPSYYYSLDGSNWTQTTNTVQDVTFTNNGKLYAKTVDTTGNTAVASTYTVTNMDTSKPNTSISTITLKTDSATIVANCTDPESGITKYEFSKDNGANWVDNGTTSSYTFGGLTQTTSYTFSVRCTNGSAVTNTVSSDKVTESITAPTIVLSSQTPSSGYSYFTSKVMRITYSASNIVTPTYQYSVDGSNWTTVTSTTKDVTFTNNGKLYARTLDSAGNTTSASTYTVTNMDPTGPSVSVSSVTVKTDSATVVASCGDSESGITKYEFSKDNGANWTSNGTTSSYTFTGLTQGTNYTFGVRCTNGSAMTNSSTKASTTSTISAPTIALLSQTPSSGYSYFTSKVMRITYSSTNITSPKYYYSLDGSNWTQATSTTQDVTFTNNGKLYAKTVDASGNTTSASTYTVTNIDSSAPSVSVSSVSTTAVTATVVASCSDTGSGIIKYEYSSNGGSSWVNGGTATSYTFTGLASATNYTFGVRCTNGSAMTNSSTKAGTTKTVTLSLGSTSGTIVSGKSTTVSIGGSNYGGLTCSSNSPSVATCSISGTTLTITGKSAEVTNQTTTITVKESYANKTATYTVTVQPAYTCATGTLTKSGSSYICVANNPLYYEECDSYSCNYCWYDTTEYGEDSSCGYASCNHDSTCYGEDSSCGYASCNHNSTCYGEHSSCGYDSCNYSYSCTITDEDECGTSHEHVRSYADYAPTAQAGTCTEDPSTYCDTDGCSYEVWDCSFSGGSAECDCWVEVYEVSAKSCSSTCSAYGEHSSCGYDSCNYSCTEYGEDSSCGYDSCNYSCTEYGEDSSCGYDSCYYDSEEYGCNSSECGESCDSWSNVYYCPSGWREYSNSGTSSLKCYKDATER